MPRQPQDDLLHPPAQKRINQNADASATPVNMESEFEDYSQITTPENCEEIFLKQTLKTYFAEQPELYIEIVKCIQLYLHVS